MYRALRADVPVFKPRSKLNPLAAAYVPRSSAEVAIQALMAALTAPERSISEFSKTSSRSECRNAQGSRVAPIDRWEVPRGKPLNWTPTPEQLALFGRTHKHPNRPCGDGYLMGKYAPVDWEEIYAADASFWFGYW